MSERTHGDHRSDHAGGTGPQPYEPPQHPEGPDRRAALGAVDLLLTLDAEIPMDAAAVPPVPEDPALLRFLARTAHEDRPGGLPPWLLDACPEAVDDDPEGRSGGWADSWYLAGGADEDEVLEVAPALVLAVPPPDWQQTALLVAAERALTRLLRQECGTDPDAWLRLLAALHEQPVTTRLTWPALIAEARDTAEARDAAEDRDAAEARAGAGDREDAGRADGSRPADDPAALLAAAAAEQVDSYAVGHPFVPWLPAEALLYADEAAVARLLPLLGPVLPLLLARRLARRSRRPQALLARLAVHGDPAVTAELARLRGPELPEPLVRRMLARSELPVVHALLVHHPDPAVRARAAAHPAPGLDGLAAGLPDRYLVGAIRSTCPRMVELGLVRAGHRLRVPEQLLGALNLLRYGGPQRLAALADDDRFGRAVTSSVRRALASADPLRTLEARTAKEFTAARLVTRLHRLASRGRHGAAHCRFLPYDFDWALLEAEHARRPFALWPHLVDHPDTPVEVALRHRAALSDAAEIRWWDTPELYTARTAHGFGRLADGRLAVVLDEALGRGLLSGRDLVRTAAPAARILRYLSGALARTDSPGEPIAEAAAELAGLMGLVGGAPAWQRVFDGLTGRLPDWDDHLTVAELLTGPTR
ncbi:hypothetical protein ACWGB8_36290 [Kitasatospora sp. NPDC054939]